MGRGARLVMSQRAREQSARAAEAAERSEHVRTAIRLEDWDRTEVNPEWGPPATVGDLPEDLPPTPPGEVTNIKES